MLFGYMGTEGIQRRPIQDENRPAEDCATLLISSSATVFPIHIGVSIVAKLTSFQTDIRPLFTERDIMAMKKAFDLASYDDVKAHAAAIYDRIRGIGGAVMPPPPPRGEGPWSQAQIELFGRWISDGYQP
jgi:hypothetical protein